MSAGQDPSNILNLDNVEFEEDVAEGITDPSSMINPVQIGVNAAGQPVYEDR